MNVDVLNQVVKEKYAIYHGDSVDITKNIPDDSIHYTIFSPPFSSLYTYSNSDRDMGNCKGDDEFYRHFKFLAEELYRITMPGRLLSFHCMDLPMMKSRDGVIGLKDFPALMLKIFQDCGFIYHSKVTIWKNPVTEMQRTKALGLLHKQIKKDSSMCRQGIPDYIVTVRKPGENPERITHTNESFPVGVWQNYASPVWMDIRQSDTLQKKSARAEQDEKHICFAEGTLVLTKRGYIPIESVIVNEDETLTHTGKWKKIIAKAKTRKNADVVQTKAIGVPLLISTPDHKLYAKKGYGAKPKDNLKRVNANWVEARNCSGHYLCSLLPPKMESDITETEWWVIGRWLADGHIDYREHQFFVSIGNAKLDEFKKKASGFIGKSVIYHGKSCTQIGLVNLSKSARDILRKCNHSAENKVLPVEAISLNPKLSKALFDGYTSGDGHTTKNGKKMFTSVSRGLLLGMAIVYRRATGKSAAVYAGRPPRTTVIEGRTVNCQQEWIMNISPNYSFNLIDEYAEWKKVKSIDEVGKSDVWSIQVEDDASYTAEGCVVKNCPLQLEVIQRCVELWTNPNDIVFDPFGGIGSTPYVALLMGRRAIASELKDSYFEQMKANVEVALNSEKMICNVGEHNIEEYAS